MTHVPALRHPVSSRSARKRCGQSMFRPKIARKVQACASPGRWKQQLDDAVKSFPALPCRKNISNHGRQLTTQPPTYDDLEIDCHQGVPARPPWAGLCSDRATTDLCSSCRHRDSWIVRADRDCRAQGRQQGRGRPDNKTRHCGQSRHSVSAASRVGRGLGGVCIQGWCSMPNLGAMLGDELITPRATRRTRQNVPHSASSANPSSSAAN